MCICECFIWKEICTCALLLYIFKLKARRRRDLPTCTRAKCIKFAVQSDRGCVQQNKIKRQINKLFIVCGSAISRRTPPIYASNLVDLHYMRMRALHLFYINNYYKHFQVNKVHWLLKIFQFFSTCKKPEAKRT